MISLDIISELYDIPIPFSMDDFLKRFPISEGLNKILSDLSGYGFEKKPFKTSFKVTQGDVSVQRTSDELVFELQSRRGLLTDFPIFVVELFEGAYIDLPDYVNMFELSGLIKCECHYKRNFMRKLDWIKIYWIPLEVFERVLDEGKIDNKR